MHFTARSQVSSEVQSWLHSIVHSQPVLLTLPSTLSRRSQVHSEYARKYTSESVLKYTPGRTLKDAPNRTKWHTPSLPDYMLPSKLSRRSQVDSKYAPKYTSE